MKTPEIGKGMRKMKNEREKTKIRKRERELETDNLPSNGERTSQRKCRPRVGEREKKRVGERDRGVSYNY